MQQSHITLFSILWNSGSAFDLPLKRLIESGAFSSRRVHGFQLPSSNFFCFNFLYQWYRLCRSSAQLSQRSITTGYWSTVFQPSAYPCLVHGAYPPSNPFHTLSYLEVCLIRYFLRFGFGGVLWEGFCEVFFGCYVCGYRLVHGFWTKDWFVCRDRKSVV